MAIPPREGRATYADRVVSRIPGTRSRPRASSPTVLPETTFFGRAVADLLDVPTRAELVLEEVPAPTRLAPHAVALSGEVTTHVDAEDDIGTAVGRFVLLHDPDSPEPWEGSWRIVSYAKAQMEPEVGHDPLAGQAGWSWLTDALQDADLGVTAMAGTVTCVTSESFGALAEREPSVELEIRASWTPLLRPGRESAELQAHLGAWGGLLCTLAGLPPLPEGVVALPGTRR